MASIVDNAEKYGEKHKIILKDFGKLSSGVEPLYSKNGYTPGKSIFEIVLRQPSYIDIFIKYSSGKKLLYLKDEGDKILELIGSTGLINSTFNHYSSNNKSNTNLLTEIKENISMWVFQEWFTNGKILSQELILSKLNNDKIHYKTSYYESSIKQLRELKKYFEPGNHVYDYERQGGVLTDDLYKRARKVTGKSSDNWNPADVWMIKPGYDMEPLYNASDAQVLNELLSRFYYERNIVPISLKNVTTPEATSTVIDPAKLLNEKIDMDFGFERADLSSSFANFILYTKSGFTVRAGFKASAITLSVSLEGRIRGAGYQLGAIDAIDYRKQCVEIYRYPLRNGSSLSNDIDIAKKELKEIIDRYPRISHTIRDYDHAMEILKDANDLTTNRFINLVSYMYSLLITPKSFEAHMKFCYLLAKKITDKSGLYVILQ